MRRGVLPHLRKSRGRRRRWLVASIAIGCIPLLLLYAFFRCRPILTSFAQSQAVWTATQLANAVTAQILQEYEEQCAKTISVTYDDAQTVSSIQTDTTIINTVRTAMANAIMTSIAQKDTLMASIPLGTLLGARWFSGFGPLVTFPVSYTATVLSDVSSSLLAQGINQSLYQVWVHISISLCVVTAGGRASVGTQLRYPMAEVVLLGEVPDNLTEVYGDDQSLLGQIFDYGTRS